MSQTSTRKFGAESGGQTMVEISGHARQRWAERTPAETSLQAAWNQSVAVTAPAADSTAARLYEPYDALLVVKQGTLRTVLYNDGRIDTTGLTECSACGDLVDPVDDETCRWCGAKCGTTGTPGRVTLTRGDI
jgi:hypothetical protein